MKCSVIPIPGLGQEGEVFMHGKGGRNSAERHRFCPDWFTALSNQNKVAKPRESFKNSNRYVWSSLDMSSMYKHIPEAWSTETLALC
jgi:hypothetical protein